MATKFRFIEDDCEESDDEGNKQRREEREEPEEPEELATTADGYVPDNFLVEKGQDDEPEQEREEAPEEREDAEVDKEEMRAELRMLAETHGVKIKEKKKRIKGTGMDSGDEDLVAELQDEVQERERERLRRKQLRREERRKAQGGGSGAKPKRPSGSNGDTSGSGGRYSKLWARRKELGVGGKKIKKKKAPPQKAERKLAKRVDLFS